MYRWLGRDLTGQSNLALLGSCVVVNAGSSELVENVRIVGAVNRVTAMRTSASRALLGGSGGLLRWWVRTGSRRRMRGRAGFRVTADDDDLFDRDGADSDREESSRGTDEVETHFDGCW
jgi:hypothetical protein